MRDIKKFKRLRNIIPALGLVLTIIFFVQAKPVDSYFEISKNLDIFTTLIKNLNTFYVDPIEPGKLIKVGVDAMLDELDPYTKYITESDIEEFEFQMTGKYGGIGAGMHKKNDDILIGDVYENSPAQKAGLHPGDLLMEIDEHSLKGKTLDDISQLLKGAPGTQLTVKVKSIYTNLVSVKIVTRGEIEVSSMPYAGFVGKQKNIAYLKLTQFTPACSRLLKNALDSLKKLQPDIKGVVLDLRNNPGGLLDEAVSICNLFIDKDNLVVSTKGKLRDLDKDYKTTAPVWDKNILLTVLMNHSSASASEIVAGTIQDLDRGIIIGERSYGKGLVQNVHPLGYNARLKVTIAKYYTPSGRCIQAIDYTHRNADGSVGAIADSLKKEFKTKSGRKVFSGGGVEPDLNVKSDQLSLLAVTLYSKNLLFDYATQYAQKHPTIPPAADFALTETEYSQFAKWLEDKDFSYRSETQIDFDSLKNSAIRDKYFDDAKTEFNALLAKITPDKKKDLLKHKDEVQHLLENEIVSRYYFARGRIAQGMRYDTELTKAIGLIDEPAKYAEQLRARN